MRRFRLLPAVIVLGLALLVLKGTGIVREAQAAQGAALPAEQTAAPPEDFAGGDDDSGSAAEVDVLSSLSKRRAELDKRELDQQMRGNVLAATEKRVDGKIAALKALEARITMLIGQRDEAQEAQVKSLVKTYSSMKPKDAARIFDGLSDDVLIPVAQAMKSDALAPVLAAMNPAAAQKLTVKLASRLALPEKAEPDVAQASAAPPLQGITPQAQAAATTAAASPDATAPAAQAAATPPPQQQAAPTAAPKPAPTKRAATPKQQQASATPKAMPQQQQASTAPKPDLAQQQAAVTPKPSQQQAAATPAPAPPQAATVSTQQAPSAPKITQPQAAAPTAAKPTNG